MKSKTHTYEMDGPESVGRSTFLQAKAFRNNVRVEPADADNPLDKAIARELELNFYLGMSWTHEELDKMNDNAKEDLLHDLEIICELSWDFEPDEEEPRPAETINEELACLDSFEKQFRFELEWCKTPYWQRKKALKNELFKPEI